MKFHENGSFSLKYMEIMKFLHFGENDLKWVKCAKLTKIYLIPLSTEGFATGGAKGAKSAKSCKMNKK